MEKEKPTIGSARVFYAQIPRNLHCEEFDLPICSDEREREIADTANPRLKRQRYCVWQLLLQALRRVFGEEANGVTFTKSPSGKWGCSLCEFSLSHGDEVVAVAIADRAIGVDVEKIRPTHEALAQKILTQQQKEICAKLTPQEANKFLLTEWCKRESIFKALQNGTVLTPTYPANLDTQTKVIGVDGDRYLLCVATEGACEALFTDCTAKK